MNWAGCFKEHPPKKVFIVHGDDEVVDEFAKDVHDTLGYETYAPYSGDGFDLISGRMISEGSKVAKEKKKSNLKPSSNVFARLLAAGQRLMHVIEKCEGMANKDLAKFADQITALSDKWDR